VRGGGGGGLFSCVCTYFPRVRPSVRVCFFPLLGTELRARWAITATITPEDGENRGARGGRGGGGERATDVGEEKETCAKNNDRPIQRLRIAGIRITGLNQFHTHTHMVQVPKP